MFFGLAHQCRETIPYRLFKHPIKEFRHVLSPAGFEPAHPKIVGLKSTALDHSAMMTFYLFPFLELL